MTPEWNNQVNYIKIISLCTVRYITISIEKSMILLCPLWFPFTNYMYERDWRKYINNIYYWLIKRKRNANKRCNIATFVCLSQTRTYISNVSWSSCVELFEVEVVVGFVDLDGILSLHCLNFLLINVLFN